MAEDKRYNNAKLKDPGKRETFRTLFKRFGIVLVGTIAGQSMILSRQTRSAEALRPPGALTDLDFDAQCIRCGLCVDGCPYDILKLASWADPAPQGTPYFVAREEPCRMCTDIPCAKACPTGALDRHMTDIKKANMGVAVLVGHETCLNYKGLIIPTVHSDMCTGCGTCEKHCVLSESAIRVLPRELGLGLSGRNSVGRS